MRKKSYVLILFASLAVLCAALVGCGKSESATYHRVSVAECEHGRVYVTYRGEEVGGATAGERLSINLLPDTGYEVDYVKIDGAASEGVYFDMPDNDVSISAAFKRVTYGVTVPVGVSGGTIAADKTTAAYGEKITVTVTPDEGYVLKERTLVANNTEIYKPRATEAIVTEFVMPPCDVAIKGEFVSTETFVTRISTLEEYISFANAVNGGDNYVGRTVILENDIGTEAAPVWARVGASAANYFGGTFDGNGKTVYLRLTTDTDSDNSVGAFGYVGGATIKNLTVKGTVVKNGDNGGAVITTDGLAMYTNSSGHHSFIRVGDELYISYHTFKNDESIAEARKIRFDKVSFVTNEDGLPIIYANGPTVTLQPLPAEISGYENKAAAAIVTAEGLADDADAYWLNDGTIKIHDDSAVVDETRFRKGKGKITLGWTDYVSAKAIMIYNACEFESSFTAVDNIRITYRKDGKEAVVQTGRLEFDYSTFSLEDRHFDCIFAGASVSIQFADMDIRKIEIEISEPKTGDTFAVSEVTVLGRTNA